MWLLWWHEGLVPVGTTLTLADLPPAALAAPHSVLAGGKVDLTVESKVNLGVFSYTRTSRMTVNVPHLPVSAVPIVSPPQPP